MEHSHSLAHIPCTDYEGQSVKITIIIGSMGRLPVNLSTFKVDFYGKCYTGPMVPIGSPQKNEPIFFMTIANTWAFFTSVFSYVCQKNTCEKKNYETSTKSIEDLGCFWGILFSGEKLSKVASRFTSKSANCHGK